MPGVFGVSTLAAVCVLLISGQALIGRRAFWLPRWLLERRVRRERFEMVLRFGRWAPRWRRSVSRSSPTTACSSSWASPRARRPPGWRSCPWDEDAAIDAHHDVLGVDEQAFVRLTSPAAVAVPPDVAGHRVAPLDVGTMVAPWAAVSDVLDSLRSAARALVRGAVITRDAVWLWVSQNAFQHAAALGFYTLFSLAPLLIVLVAVAGVVLGPDAAAGEVEARLDALVGSRAAQAVQEAVLRSRPAEAGILPSLLGLTALLMGSTTVFAQLQSSINQFWGVTARPSRSGVLVFLSHRLASFGLVLSIGFLLLVSLVVSTAVTTAVRVAGDWMPIPAPVATALDMATSLFVVTLLFAAILKMLPDVRLAWRDTWTGAAITAALFVGG
jgi:membrane protein